MVHQGFNRGRGRGKPKGNQFGANGRQSHGRGDKRKDMGRQEYFRNKDNHNDRNREDASKRLKLDDNGTWTTVEGPFSKEEIEAEDRRPKRKVAVMIGYSGTGYRGMQIMPDLPTIEGDLFKAMIKAGAISKANASDPKKSSLVRCARTDKGVHAAGNVISLKLIVEDEDIVQKINEHLPAQIRVWGIERTVGSFSCYQACDSRWYEYLIPTHCFLPPHPTSFLGKKLDELAEEIRDVDAYRKRQEEVSGWWAEAEEKYIKPVLEGVDEDIRADVSHSMYKVHGVVSSFEERFGESGDEASDAEEATDFEEAMEEQEDAATDSAARGDVAVNMPNEPREDIEPSEKTEEELAEERKRRDRINDATRRLRQAYIVAKASYRLSSQRLDRIKDALSQFVGTWNHHNYTVRKAPSDPSAKRHIKSFVPVAAPLGQTETGTYMIGDTEWLSIKVHGQSFMMHQIRKMISMAALVVRCGTRPSIIRESLNSDVVIAVPKAPSLGLLLERPVFESYNTHRAAQFEREPIVFDKYEKAMDAFKRSEIYQRIYDEEETEHVFQTFFAQLDEYKNRAFLYVSSKGFEAAKGTRDASNKKIQKGNRHSGKKPNPRKRKAEAVENAQLDETRLSPVEQVDKEAEAVEGAQLEDAPPSHVQNVDKEAHTAQA